MPDVIRNFIQGTEILFGDSKKNDTTRSKQADTKKELRLAKTRTKQGSLNRSISRIKKIKEDALSWVKRV